MAVRQKEFTQHFPKPGMVEHDPMEIWATEYAMMTEAVTSLGLGERTSPPSESPTSARPLSCGTPRQENLFIMPSCGRIEGLLNIATRSRPRE